MPPPIRPKTFGRRSNGPVPRPKGGSVARAISRSPSDYESSLKEVGQRLFHTLEQKQDIRRVRSEGEIPWSGRAAFLAGLITAFLTAGNTLVSAKLGIPDSSVAGGVSGLAGIHPGLVVPALMGLSLLSAGGDLFWTLLSAHFVLKRIGKTSLLAYAGAGIVSNIVIHGSSLVLGFGAGGRSLATSAAIAGCAGFFYRLFAGARPSK